MCAGTTEDLKELLRRAFLTGYDCGRSDEREDKDQLANLPLNVLDFERFRDRRVAASR